MRRTLCWPPSWPRRAQPIREASRGHAQHLRSEHRQIAAAVGLVIFIEPAQGRIQLGGKARQINRLVRELDQATMAARRAGLLRENRANVKIDHGSAHGFSRHRHGPLNFLTDEVLPERRQEVPGPSREAQSAADRVSRNIPCHRQQNSTSRRRWSVPPHTECRSPGWRPCAGWAGPCRDPPPARTRRRCRGPIISRSKPCRGSSAATKPSDAGYVSRKWTSALPIRRRNKER